MILTTAFCTSLVSVCAKAIQQRNVQGEHYLAIFPVSMVMATLDVLSWHLIQAATGTLQNVLLILALSTGSSIGAYAGIKFHKRFISKEST